jgi:hypothetical protein
MINLFLEQSDEPPLPTTEAYQHNPKPSVHPSLRRVLLLSGIPELSRSPGLSLRDTNDRLLRFLDPLEAHGKPH